MNHIYLCYLLSCRILAEWEGSLPPDRENQSIPGHTWAVVLFFPSPPLLSFVSSCSLLFLLFFFLFEDLQMYSNHLNICANAILGNYILYSFSQPRRPTRPHDHSINYPSVRPFARTVDYSINLISLIPGSRCYSSGCRIMGLVALWR